ncbi:MAG: hypothetical protein CVU11_15060 [Bacteroidetes bacterium HGW-Bacteroidetes-6]|jgi:hypothetical protein|nr:MAG: hypothetical protein CVU11_15060 [Bacteroidetes bacterium HGW-Bacteroidetes-6]
MGIGFTIDTPLKVAPYGISSVISLVDDILMERLREYYSQKEGLPFTEIPYNSPDRRSRRITAYLDLIKELTEKRFSELKNNKKDTLRYLDMLPAGPEATSEWQSQDDMALDSDILKMGSIDVNIMTKLDRIHFKDGEMLPSEENDAHTALRGFAESKLCSSVVFSAGMNPSLYNYISQFDDFYPDANGHFKKKITLKISDYRSAIIQGKFLAKKGLWVSEYRVESGLNCGGHAFATQGYLMGPILAEIRDNREELQKTIFEIFATALEQRNRPVPSKIPAVRISAQGGVGTAEEHRFLMDHYKVDSVGWGSPFLLVPEATNADEDTLQQLADAKEEDLYLSNISPLGVPFNNLRNNSKDVEKNIRIVQGKPGSTCPKRYMVFSVEDAEHGHCPASREYQTAKLEELNAKGLSEELYKIEREKIIEKACICVGLGTAALLINKMETKVEGTGVSVCPGPNMAYFSQKMTLEEITGHIYGRNNVISRIDRPHMFIKELESYIEFLKAKVLEVRENLTSKQARWLQSFVINMQEGTEYYIQLFNGLKESFREMKQNTLKQLEEFKAELQRIHGSIEELAAIGIR